MNGAVLASLSCSIYPIAKEVLGCALCASDCSRRQSERWKWPSVLKGLRQNLSFPRKRESNEETTCSIERIAT